MAISILPEHVANQIAAGEVVEGPSSIIKELVENSIDAQATKINIEVSKQLLKIQVIDNGCGISPDDLPLAFKRHATSKISSIEDLLALKTQGFRGEALASIAAVSKLTCISKRDQDDHATKIYIENDQEEISNTGASTGTNITIDELFFNTPARLKFLKSNNKERNLIIDTVRSLAIANPELAFSLNIDSRSSLKTSGSGDLKQCLKEIFSDEIYQGLIPVKHSNGDIDITGYCSQTHITRSDKRGIFTIVNKRLIKCHIIRSAVEAVYKDLLNSGKHPIAVIYVDIPAQDVDINVHPRKSEVRYQHTNRIYATVGDAVAKALADSHYQSKTSFQPSFKDYSLSQANTNPADLNQDLTTSSQHFTYSKQESTSKQESILQETQEDAAMEVIAEHFDPLETPRKKVYRDDFSYTLPDHRLGSSSREFISRFGSVDISLTQSQGLKDIITSQGNKTSFELAISNDSSPWTLLIRGDFIGEGWLKDRYLSFLHELGAEILKRETLERNFKTPEHKASSRPQSKPNLSTLEEIWQRDNYTCVYCGKLLIHPNTIKESLPQCSDPETLNQHLASYDHHLPASKFPALNDDKRNLYACCQECNRQKSNSLASKTWEPKSSNAWADYSKDRPFEIGKTKLHRPN